MAEMIWPEALIQKLKGLPEDPGVYQMLDLEGKVLYVGKAKVLKNRVRSYFQNKQQDPKTKALLRKINDFKILTVETELEALILENQLIKRLQPPFNILLRDDKNYPFIKITFQEDFPRVMVVRKKEEDGSQYFGPYHSHLAIRRAMDWVRELFPYRTCGNPLPKQACLEYYIHQCPAPCENKISREDYRKHLDKISEFLSGDYQKVLEHLNQQMKTASDQMQYELAARYRDQRERMLQLQEKQNLVVHDAHAEFDLWELAETEDYAVLMIFEIRSGRIQNEHCLTAQQELQEGAATLLEQSFLHFYENKLQLPPRILLPKRTEASFPLLQGWLDKHGKGQVEFPRADYELSFSRIAHRNAFLSLERERVSRSISVQRQSALLELQSLLQMKQLPLVIEGFDISHSQGLEIVASMVYFKKGQPQKNQYRKYKIRSVQTGQSDDFKSMHEVVFRRYKRLLLEKKELPDVVLIDGGKGQLESAITALKELDLLGRIKLMSLAKEYEEIFIPNQKNSIVLPHSSALLKMLQHVRDEAHRFAITFHRQRRTKRELNL